MISGECVCVFFVNRALSTNCSAQFHIAESIFCHQWFQYLYLPRSLCSTDPTSSFSDVLSCERVFFHAS